MRYAVIENDTVVNVVVADAGWSDPAGRESVQSDTLGKGMVRVNGEWTEPDNIEHIRSLMIVSRFQARAALHLAGLLDTVQTLMDDPATDPIARLAWQDAQEFRRTSPTITTLAVALGLTDEQLDDLFTTAAGIDA